MKSVPKVYALRFSVAALLSTAGLGSLPACSKSDEAKPAERASQTQVQAPLPKKDLVKCSPGADGSCEASAACSPACVQVASPECAACEAASDCFEFANNCAVSALSEEERALCYEILSCVQASDCFDGPASIGSCFCGGLSHDECLKAPLTGPGAPDGACRELIVKGTPRAETSAHILGLLTLLTHPAGYALARVNCQKRGSHGICAEKCGFGASAAPAVTRPAP